MQGLPATPSVSSKNPLSVRLSQILAASYTDNSLKDALDALTLDARFADNSPDRRRQLKGELELDVIEQHGAVIEEFGRIVNTIDRIGDTLGTVSQTHRTLLSHANAANIQASRVLSSFDGLHSQTAALTTKATILTRFFDNFTMAESEVLALTSSSEPVDEAFFAAYERCKKINASCETLLTTDNQKLGLDIIERTQHHLDMASVKLHSWLQRQFRTLSLATSSCDLSNENTPSPTLLRRAIATLSAQSPALFDEALDSLSSTRQRAAIHSFMRALTEGEDGSRPIDMLAHDPLRYVGDMLAWLHQAVANEREVLDVLVGTRSGAMSDLVDRNLEGVGKPLRSRTEHVLITQEDPVLIYKIASLIRFYKFMLIKALGKESVVVDNIQLLEAFSLQHFSSALHGQRNTTLASLDTVPDDLSPPPFLVEAVSQLRQLIVSYDASLIPAVEREEGFRDVLDDALWSYLEACEKMVLQDNKMKRHEGIVFVVNCVECARRVVEMYAFTQNAVNTLKEKEARLVEELVGDTYRFFLEESGVEVLLSALHSAQPSTPLSSLPAFTTPSLATISAQLDAFLPSALMDAHTRLERLYSSRVGSGVIYRGAERFLRDFGEVEGAIVGEEGAVEFPRTVWPRTRGEVAVLLGLE
ncbi:oligomeric complex COG6 [Saitoella complicata NRRL Y-17804]|nr:oligomeric complex COG6 [Saitoella complicata NRRL Y-17804]ODQ49616.1 oligomeric complex COG6 [Saitoella complicata NRRL Y-17804]